MNRVPGDRFAFNRTNGGALKVSSGKTLYVLEAQDDVERTIDPGDIEATETLATIYASDTGDTEVTQPLLSGEGGAFDVFYVDPGDYDLYSPSDSIRPIKRWNAVSYSGQGGKLLGADERTTSISTSVVTPTTLDTGLEVTVPTRGAVFITLSGHTAKSSAAFTGGFILVEDGVSLGAFGAFGNSFAPVHCRRRRTPTPGEHTWNILATNGSAGTLDVAAGPGLDSDDNPPLLLTVTEA